MPNLPPAHRGFARAPEAEPPDGAEIRLLPFSGDAARLVSAVGERHPAAVAALYDRYEPLVSRLLASLLGPDRELADLRHDVFAGILRSLGRLRDPTRLEAWITAVTVRTAHKCLRGRMRRWWLRLWPDGEPAACAAAPSAPPEVAEAVRCTYAVLEGMQRDERVAFVLRFVEGMELVEVAASCGVSLATAKRRLARAQATFIERARAHEALHEWIDGGSRWGRTEKG